MTGFVSAWAACAVLIALYMTAWFALALAQEGQFHSRHRLGPRIRARRGLHVLPQRLAVPAPPRHGARRRLGRAARPPHPRPEQEARRGPPLRRLARKVGPLVRLAELPPGLPAPGLLPARHRLTGHPRQHRPELPVRGTVLWRPASSSGSWVPLRGRRRRPVGPLQARSGEQGADHGPGALEVHPAPELFRRIADVGRDMAHRPGSALRLDDRRQPGPHHFPARQGFGHPPARETIRRERRLSGLRPPHERLHSPGSRKNKGDARQKLRSGRRRRN